MGKFDDRGIISKNRKRSNEKAPHYTGVINFSGATLKRLLEEHKDKDDAKIYVSVWRSDEDPERLNLKIDQPYNGARAGSGPGVGSRERLTRDGPGGGPDDYRPRQREEDARVRPRDEYHDRADGRAVRDAQGYGEFDDRPRNAASQRPAPRRDDPDDPWGDDIPFGD